MKGIDFANKVVLVTGGGAGIGRSISETFSELGAKLIVAELDKDRCQDIEINFKNKGVDALVSNTDVRDAKAVKELLKEVETRYKKLDVLVNNVGDFLGLTKPFTMFSDEEIDALYATNLKSMFFVTRSAIPLLKKHGGLGASIINISSIEAFRGIPMATVYCSFKHAITGFTKSLAVELAPSKIRVNAIAPETTETAQVSPSQLVAEEHQDHEKRWIPLERFGKPSDAAGCALFLASELSAWVTGTTINLDGGALAAGGWYRDPNNFWTNVPVITGNGFNF
tara:strand:- start:2087 stop:2932 length:846 start_codon:yes stop_codon:yes gene_type:complete